ncbi:hypothetical protein TEQG_01051 [Trichophyton equinum CBS 127.97]|uniref:Uncharacterized protein n=1 Tax=Trichophyton equinum (strain ATCC MYA-4606 / CBS 127.97) TaxID=559882 RepID=F2PJE4_TRIEC|nr:hypothetical protein TEQG_01051 [Trichophyton equinum CBS 127.97]
MDPCGTSVTQRSRIRGAQMQDGQAITSEIAARRVNEVKHFGIEEFIPSTEDMESSKLHLPLFQTGNKRGELYSVTGQEIVGLMPKEGPVASVACIIAIWPRIRLVARRLFSRETVYVPLKPYVLINRRFVRSKVIVLPFSIPQPSTP